jgi:hypothetical protein
MIELLEVTAYDSGNLQATVIRPNEPDPEPVVVELVGGVTPVVGQLAWVETSRAGWVLIANHKSVGAAAATNPSLYVRKGATSAFNSGARTGISFGTAVPIEEVDIGYTGNGGTGGNVRVTFEVAGWYLVIFYALWADSAVGRRFVEWQNSSGVVVASTRHEVEGPAGQEMTTHCVLLKPMAVNEWVEPYGFQSSGAALSIQDQPFSNVISAKRIP